MTKYIKIKSKNKCPECGGNEWYPLSDEDSLVGVKPISFNPKIESNKDAYGDINPVVDVVFDEDDECGDIHFDQCAYCWTVVSG
jgi:hypothetical protein